MGRPKKIKDEDMEIKKENNAEQDKATTFDDFMTPENMMKMFAMFKQMETMQQESQEKKSEIVKNEQKEDDQYKPFTKSMLMKIKNEEVTVRSVVENVSFTSPMTKIKYRWKVKGNVQSLPISEIIAMDNVSQRFLYTPWVVVEDNRVIDAFGLRRTYDLIKKVENISQLIKLEKEELKEIFDELPKNYQNNFKNEIFRKVRTRELNDLKTIDNLSDILHIDLSNIESEDSLRNKNINRL